MRDHNEIGKIIFKLSSIPLLIGGSAFSYNNSTLNGNILLYSSIKFLFSVLIIFIFAVYSLFSLVTVLFTVCSIYVVVQNQ